MKSILGLSLALVLALSGCSSESKAAPYLKQICADWKTTNYSGGSIESRENITTKVSSQVSSAVALDPEASAGFQIVVNLMKNVAVLEGQEAEYSGKAFYARLVEKNLNQAAYWDAKASERSKEASTEKVNILKKFSELCEAYQE